jgi:hypothetical protein
VGYTPMALQKKRKRREFYHKLPLYGEQSLHMREMEKQKKNENKHQLSNDRVKSMEDFSNKNNDKAMDGKIMVALHVTVTTQHADKCKKIKNSKINNVTVSNSCDLTPNHIGKIETLKLRDGGYSNSIEDGLKIQNNTKHLNNNTSAPNRSLDTVITKERDIQFENYKITHINDKRRQETPREREINYPEGERKDD